MANVDPSTVDAFNDKWATRWSGRVSPGHAERTFALFFSLFPFEIVRHGEGFDLGCGVGRHAAMIAPRVGKLHCIDPSPNAIARAKAALAGQPNVDFHVAGVDEMPIADQSQDFGISMGVLHHVPDTEGALARCAAKLKAGAPFLLYLYYRFDNRPVWFRAIWRLTDLARRFICRLPLKAKRTVSDGIALSIYWPLSRLSRLLERCGANVANVPLSFYRHTPLVNLKVSAFDRFGTPLEQRFTRLEIEAMMRRCGLEHVCFQETAPYWVALGYRSRDG